MAFARKQRAIRDAVRIGDQIIRRKRRMLLAGTFNAWKLRAGIYRQVARRFQASLQLTLRWAWTQWKAQLATQVLVLLYTYMYHMHLVVFSESDFHVENLLYPFDIHHVVLFYVFYSVCCPPVGPQDIQTSKTAKVYLGSVLSTHVL